MLLKLREPNCDKQTHPTGLGQRRARSVATTPACRTGRSPAPGFRHDCTSHGGRAAPGPPVPGLRRFRIAAPVRMIEDDVARLVEAINHELGVATVADTVDSAVWRATSRLEVHIEGLLDRFDDVRRVKPENGDARAHSLLCGVYRDLLEQVQTTLNEIVVSLDDPVLALRRRGLPTQGRVDLTIALDTGASVAGREPRTVGRRTGDGTGKLRAAMHRRSRARSHGPGCRWAQRLAKLGVGRLRSWLATRR